MTYCIAMKVEEGIVGLADTLITSGREMTTLRKVVSYSPPGGTMFVMTSGLRSLRDKTFTYFENALTVREKPFDRMFEAVNLLAEQVRQVAREDKAAIVEDGLSFDIHALVGGQMQKDTEAKLYLLYPAGNWVDTGVLTPYHIIGSTGYGKPVLDRTWSYDRGLDDALRIGLLAFDATHTSASDVDYPVDVVMYQAGSFELQEQRLTGEDMAPLSQFWQAAIQRAVDESAPTTRDLFERIEQSPPAETRYGDNGH